MSNSHLGFAYLPGTFDLWKPCKSPIDIFNNLKMMIVNDWSQFVHLLQSIYGGKKGKE